ncbi:cobalt-factor II C(20)-methyltransferase [Acidianus sp. HS-5]|uniref:cobalt-factor II C(20)-methyltransferase n=1 Tax=Acidianus sp. HS-5 TaxID=2886040 RepID=UPI001F2BB5C0|nr:cobalt-factor II C(20)-methyltransferase [Acidianus sp. HS-5]BDC17932.1 precorrin-2 C(20)-methyltransferase [Acidianus sp. HS-5]
MIYVIGLGPGDPELITLKAMKVLSSAEVVFVPYSTGTNRSLALGIVEKFTKGEIVTLGFPMKKEVSDEELKAIAKTICEKAKEVSAFVTLGDPTLYSTFFRVFSFLNCQEVEIIPGVTSITACPSKIKIPLALKNEAIAVIPADRLDLIDLAKGKFEAIVVMKANENLEEIKSILSSYEIIYARRCYMEGEKIDELKGNEEKDYFATLICKVKEK